MKSSLKQTENILEVLALKRQLIEKTLAEINLKFSQIEKKLGELSRRFDAPRLGDDARISFAIAAQKWEVTAARNLASGDTADKVKGPV